MSGHTVLNEGEVRRPALTAADVCEILNIVPRTLYRLIDKGDIRAFKVGRDYRIAQDELDRFMTVGTDLEKGSGVKNFSL